MIFRSTRIKAAFKEKQVFDQEVIDRHKKVRTPEKFGDDSPPKLFTAGKKNRPEQTERSLFFGFLRRRRFSEFGD